MSRSTTVRPELPARIKELQNSLKQCLSVLESGRENDFYAFAWYEEKMTFAVEAKRTVATNESRDRGVVFRIMCNGQQYECQVRRDPRLVAVVTAYTSHTRYSLPRCLPLW